MKLLTPLRIGNVELNNRLVMAPMRSGKAQNGKVTADQCRYYQKCAGQSAMGLVIAEHHYISRQGQAKSDQNGIADDSFLDGLYCLAEAIHAGGSRAMVQINHAGSTAHSYLTGCEVVAPSAVLNPSMSDMQLPRELSVSEIEEIEEQFAQAALRVKATGFDGVEIHAAHGYLLNQFFSPITNKRTDAYTGRTIEGRMRSIIETYQKVRAATGPGFLVSVRLGGCDYSEGGSTISDAVQACQRLSDEGVDFIDISGGMCRYTRSDHNEPGYFRDMTKAIKNKITIPVVLTGGVTTFEQAEHLLEEGCADLIGIGRALLRDPNWALKEKQKVLKKV